MKMNKNSPIAKYTFLCIYILANCLYMTSTVASEPINLEKILTNSGVLKEIAQKIFNQPTALNAIKAKLIAEHGPNAKTVWQAYDKTMLGNDKTFSGPAQFATFIKSGNNIAIYPQLQSLTRDDLRSLIGKKVNTFYAQNELDNMQTTVQNAINSGTYGPNLGGQQQTPNNFAITYNIGYGEICTRPNTNDSGLPIATNDQGACLPATRVIIIFEADTFFENIISNQDYTTWKTIPPSGKIVRIM
jgi:hypothetical protein